MAQVPSKASSDSEVAASSATAYIGLTKSVLDLLGSTSPINQIANNILKWMGREGINESDFNYCVERCRALAYPNEYGLVIRESILRSEKKIAKVGGLHLISAGAIGRWMAFSQDHAYMVTTVAAAMKYQGLQFTSELLCELILSDKDDNVNEVKRSYSYPVDRARLMGVLSKIVESILLNVINPGHKLDELPEEFQSFCVHLVSAELFARTILKITRSGVDLLLLCDRFQGDLLLWVLAHFDGSITVSVAGKQIFKRNSGRSKRRFTMLVKTTCQNGCGSTNHKVELSELLEGKWARTLDGRDDGRDHPGKGIYSAYRMPLYSTDPANHCSGREMLNREESYAVRILAQRFILWMLDLPLQTQNSPKSFKFDINFGPETPCSDLRLADILYRWPTLLHDSADNNSEMMSTVRLMRTPPSHSHGMGPIPLSALCAYFPALSDLIVGISKRCNCRTCRDGHIEHEYREGCLQGTAISLLFLLIGNAIADGFGVRDASGLLSLNEYTSEVHTLLSDLARGSVWWDRWFNIAASTVLGYSPKQVSYSPHGAGALVGVQFGSNVVAVKWLDLSQKLRVQKCFALEIAEGQIADVSGHFACIYSGVKLELACNLAESRSQPLDPGLSDRTRLFLEKDQSSPKLQHAIIGSEHEASWYLITFVGTESSQRIIDPADALAGAVCSTFLEASESRCRHRREASQRVKEDDESTERPMEQCHVWSFDGALKNWETINRNTFLTDCLDTELKLNVTLSLSSKGCVVREATTCFCCALEAAEAHREDFSHRIITYEMDKQMVVRRSK